jgi:hypothetical protein
MIAFIVSHITALMEHHFTFGHQHWKICFDTAAFLDYSEDEGRSSSRTVYQSSRNHISSLDRIIKV